MRNIGRVLLSADRVPDGQPAKDIATWARALKLDGVVWTQLSSNFELEVKRPFSVDEAVAHIRRLPPAGKVKAAEYVWRAREFVRTPVRTALQKEPWFVEDDGT